MIKVNRDVKKLFDEYMNCKMRKEYNLKRYPVINVEINVEIKSSEDCSI